MKPLAPILRRSHEPKCAALAIHLRHRKPLWVVYSVGVRPLLICASECVIQRALNPFVRTAGVRERRLISGSKTHRYRSFQRLEPSPHRPSFEALPVTISRQRKAASQPSRDRSLPIRAQSFALETEHFSDWFLHRPPRISRCIGRELVLILDPGHCADFFDVRCGDTRNTCRESRARLKARRGSRSRRCLHMGFRTSSGKFTMLSSR